jgi:hypothetical protein
VEFWLRPGQPGNAPQERALLEISGDGYLLQIGQVQDGVYLWVTDFVSHEVSAWGDSWSWQAGEWHHIAATWEAHRLSLYLDGRLAGDAAMRHPITTTAPVSLSLGGTISGEYPAEAAFDELRLSSGLRLGNSERARVIAAQEMPPELRVYDLLGNLLSRYAPSGALASARALAWDAGQEAFWLADEVGGQVHRFRLLGDQLVWEGAFSLDWERGPRALAAHESGLLAVADGNRVLLYDPASARLLREWRSPNDGAPYDGAAGEFRAITALAFAPGGDDLAVLEEGNKRVSLILDAAKPHRLYMPGFWASAR